ncbi:MAG: hypothetical protein Q7R79_01995, partial [bacterium]|nr:hypothetical protein [bacterium]
MKRYQALLQKIVFTLAVVMMVGAPLYLMTSPVGPARAGVPTIVLEDVPQKTNWFFDIIFAALETAGYKTLKFFARNLANDMAVKTLGSLTSGGVGQEPLFFDKQPGLWLLDVVDEAATGLIEGTMQGAGEALDQMERDDKAESAKKAVAGLEGTAEKKTYDEYQAAINAIASLQPQVDTLLRTSPTGPYQPADQKKIDDLAIAKATKERLDTPENQALISKADTTLKAKTAADKDVTDFNASSKDRFEKFRRGEADGVSKKGAQLNNLICNPDLSFRLKLAFGGLGSAGALPIRDRKSTCTFFDLTRKDWGKVLTQTKVNGTSIDEGKRIIEQKDARAGWAVLQSMVDPNQSDLGVAFNFQNELLEEIRSTTQQKLLDRQENTPIKNLATHSGQIQTPGTFLKGFTESAINKSADKDSDPKYTGKIAADLADVAGTFLDTFLNKSQDLLFNPKKGLAAKVDDSTISLGSYGGGVTQDRGPAQFITQETSKLRISELAAISLASPGSLDALSELQSTDCAAGPNPCVITSNIVGAIRNRMTIQEAIDAYNSGDRNSSINPTSVFGYTSANTKTEPSYQEGLPYRSLVILRKYRVIPVSWELAALYIKDHPYACGEQKDCTLEYLTQEFYNDASPFYRMIDPAWLLKMPAVYCAVKGHGPSSEVDEKKAKFECLDTNGDGRVCCENPCRDGRDINPEKIDNFVQLDPRPQICLDEQTCLEDEPNGTCKKNRYGYCLEEKKSWAFPGTECKPQFASCQAFTDKQTRQTLALIQDSIEDYRDPSKRVCAQNNAGCAAYSKRQTSPASATSTPSYSWSEDPNDQVYLASNVTSCREEMEGCRKLQKDGTDVYMKIAPEYYGCTMTAATDRPFEKKECKKFALSCTS